MSCKVCKYFNRVIDKNEITKIQGACRRFPPTGYPIPHPQGVAVMTIYPTVTDKDVCGEFVENFRAIC